MKLKKNIFKEVKMVQPIDLQLKGSNAQEYFAQLKQEQNTKSNLQLKQEQNILQEIAEEIKQTLEKTNAKSEKESNSNSKTEEHNKKVGVEGLNETLNNVANMNSVIFQFEFQDQDTTDTITEAKRKEIILKVIDKETEEVLSQYPTELSLKIAKMLNQLIGKGQMADTTA